MTMNDSPATDDDDNDPVLDEMIEAAVKRASLPYEGKMPAPVLEEVKRQHRMALRHNPSMRALLEQLRPDPANVDRSHQRASKPDADAGKGTKTGNSS
jgi:hypothetical protein